MAEKKNKTRITFRNGGMTQYRLDKFPKAYQLICGDWWSDIRKFYIEKNKDRKFFGRTAELTILPQTFKEIQEELKCFDKTIYFSYNTKQMFALSVRAEEPKDKEDEQ